MNRGYAEVHQEIPWLNKAAPTLSEEFAVGCPNMEEPMGHTTRADTAKNKQALNIKPQKLLYKAQTTKDSVPKVG